MSVATIGSRNSMLSGVGKDVEQGGKVISATLKFLSIATSLGIVVTTVDLGYYLLKFYSFDEVGKEIVNQLLKALGGGGDAITNLTGAGVSCCLSSIVNLATVINIATISTASVGMKAVTPALKFGFPFTLGAGVVTTKEQKADLINSMIGYTKDVGTSIATTSNMVGEQISNIQQGVSDTVQLAKDKSGKVVQGWLDLIQNLKKNITDLSGECDRLGINIYGRFFLDDGTVTSSTVSSKSIQSMVSTLNSISQESKIQPQNMEDNFSLGVKRSRDGDTISTNTKTFNNVGEELDYCFYN